MLANIQNYGDRISAGKQVESSILNALRQKGYKIEDPTSGEDMYDKIDGWWVDKTQKKHSLQIKFRETGDDILFELVKDLDKNVDGRDMVSKAELYLVVDRNGVTRMFNTKPIKEKATQALRVIKQDLEKNPSKTDWSGSGWSIKVQVDRAHGQRKIVGYFSPKMFTPLATWNLKIHESALREFIESFIDKELKLTFSNNMIH